jgi:uncharacterized protein DUF87
VTRPSFGPGVDIDVQRLIESRLLIQANSGGGKSWAIRRLLEQTYGSCQHIVIDVEGEFHTLREKFDYVLAGPHGDCPATIQSAALLARRLLELNVSAVIDIYELGRERQRFVRLFLESLVSAPRELWHPALIVVDEADMFAPEVGHAESSGTVVDLMARGRKRGFAGCLATQRIAKLQKNAAAEANNKLIGRAALDIDMKRAAAELGFTAREDMQRLRKLPAGEFYAFGPGLADDVTLVKVGPVSTTHPRAGQRAAPPTPPRAKIREVLAQLADLPAEADAEARTATELRFRVAELERKLAARPVPPAAEIRIVERPALTDAQLAAIDNLLIKGAQVASLSDAFATMFREQAEALRAAVLSTRMPTNGAPPRQAHSSKHAAVASALPIGEAAVLRALIQHPAGLRRNQLTVLTGYKRSTRDAYIARLRERAMVETDGDTVRSTPAGDHALPDAEPLPTGAALRSWWMERLPSGERAVLAVLVSKYPAVEHRSVIDAVTGFRRSTRDAYLSRLAARQLVEDLGGGQVRASATLFEVSR